MDGIKINALRIVCAKHIIEEVVKPGTFFWILVEGRQELRRKLIDCVAKVVEAWTPPTVEGLTNPMINKWIDALKFECIVQLYLVFGAADINQARFAAGIYGV